MAIEENWWQQGDTDSSAKQVIDQHNHLINAISDAPAQVLQAAGLEPEYRDLRVSVKPVAPEAPTSVSAFIAGGRAYVTWRPPVFEGGGAVDHYNVRSSDGRESTLSAAEYDRLSYAEMAVTPSSSPRTFTVTASTSSGVSAPSLPSLPVSELDKPLPLPGAPQSVSVRVEGTRASIHFGLPKEQAKMVLAYVVTVEPGRTETFSGRRILALEGTHVTFVTVDGLIPGKHYRFGVAAVNPTGQGPTEWVEEHVAKP